MTLLQVYGSPGNRHENECIDGHECCHDNQILDKATPELSWSSSMILWTSLACKAKDKVKGENWGRFYNCLWGPMAWLGTPRPPTLKHTTLFLDFIANLCWRRYWSNWILTLWKEMHKCDILRLNKLAKLRRYASRVHFANIHFG